MNITWIIEWQGGASVGRMTEPIPAGYDETRPDQHFVLRARPSGERYAWMVDYLADDSEPCESVASGEAIGLACAQRAAIRAMLDLIDAGAPPVAGEHLSNVELAAYMSSYATAVRHNQSQAAVAGATNAEIVAEVLEHAEETGDLDADSYRRLTAAVAAFRFGLLGASSGH